jgi:hypothetical protein
MLPPSASPHVVTTQKTNIGVFSQVIMKLQQLPCATHGTASLKYRHDPIIRRCSSINSASSNIHSGLAITDATTLSSLFEDDNLWQSTPPQNKATKEQL